MNQELDCPFDFTSRCTMGRCDCKPKQETLAEAAKECLKNNSLSTEGDFAEGYVTGSLFGAKFQAERMYSEEEVMDMFHNLSMHLPLHYEFLVKEQFKNK